MMNAEEKSNICDQQSCFNGAPQHASAQNVPFVFWKPDWLLPNISAYFHLHLQRIASSSIVIGFRKLAVFSPCLTFGKKPSNKLEIIEALIFSFNHVVIKETLINL
ncbi:UNVERIFIED_CONTAM: hypothetical protein NCL1_47745 [Trichonephila clavipes]